MAKITYTIFHKLTRIHRLELPSGHPNFEEPPRGEYADVGDALKAAIAEQYEVIFCQMCFPYGVVWSPLDAN